MNPIEILKKITPDAHYARRSKIRILESRPTGTVLGQFTFQKLISHTIEFGSSIALAGLLVILVLGGFSIFRFLNPLQLSSLNPTSLRAEAQAVQDIQLELSDLQYAEPMPVSTTSTAETPKAARVRKNSAQSVSDQVLNASSSEAAPTVDDILDALAE